MLFVFVAIEIGADIPSESVIDKWLGEPIKAAILPTSTFLTNKKGFPVLSKAHQRIIFRLFKAWAQNLPYFDSADFKFPPVILTRQSLFTVGGPVHLYRYQSAHREGLQMLPAIPRIPQSEQACTQCLRDVCQGLWRLPTITSTGGEMFLYNYVSIFKLRFHYGQDISFFCLPFSPSWTIWSLRPMKCLRRIPLNILSTSR